MYLELHHVSVPRKMGCCPDMCPEKVIEYSFEVNTSFVMLQERYEREIQKRLSIFEIDTSKQVLLQN